MCRFHTKHILSVLYGYCVVFLLHENYHNYHCPLSIPLTVVFSKTPSQLTHCCDVIMRAMASQITGVSIVYLTVCSDTHQRKHQSSASLAFVLGIHRGSMNSLRKWQVRRKNVSIWWRYNAGCIMPLQSPNPVWTFVLCCVKYRAISCTAIYRVSACVCAY